MFNFNFYFLIYFFKNDFSSFSLFNQGKCHILNQLLFIDEIRFIHKKSLKIILMSYLLQQALLFLSFIILGFFIFSSMMNIFHFDNLLLGIQTTLNDFLSFHYISFFIMLVSLFSITSCINLYFQHVINIFVKKLKGIHFPVSYYFQIIHSDLEKLHSLPVYELLNKNNNLYGLLLLLVVEKHVEKEEIKYISEYFIKNW